MDKKELQHKTSALIRCWGELVETLFVNKKDFLFNSGREIFNKNVVQEVLDRFSNNPDTSNKNFEPKVKKQFANASDEAKRLFVHAEYIYLMISTSVKSDTKKQKIEDWGLGKLNDRVVLDGISKPGPHYQRSQFFQIVFVLNIFKKIIDSPPQNKEDINRMIEKYCKENEEKNIGISNAILFFIKPDYYERILSHRHRCSIVSHYDHLIRDNPDYNNMDMDKKISQIKQVLRQKRNIPDIDFFEDLKAEWDMKKEKPKKGEMVKENKPKMKHESGSINENTINTAAPKIPHPLNQILYGPPGTGKTYRTTELAKEILGIKDDDINNIKSLRQAYPEQVEFITFHQNFAYEDFIEGIKPNVDNDNENISYSIEEGIFKEIAINATKNLEGANKANSLQTPDKRIVDTEKLLEDFADYYEEERDKGNPINLPGTQTPIIRIIPKKDGSLRSFKVQPGGKGGSEKSLTAKNILRNYPDFCTGKISSAQDIKSTQVPNRPEHGNAPYLFKFFELLRDFQKDQEESNYWIEVEKKNYVLIIDEINRGNMAKVFGELITLLEDTKRLGEEEEMQLTLQYSKEEFGVPNNLFIIGTMNTADRSIAVMDTALRRRFVFTECMPDTDLLNDNVEGVDCKKLLMAINQRIVVLASREKQIGHSYLMHVKTMDDLKNAFQQKIIPLLKEYFFDNWENIKNVLNEAVFINKDEKFVYVPSNLKNSGGDIYEWLDFNDGQWDIPDSYKKIYQMKGEDALPSEDSSGTE